MKAELEIVFENDLNSSEHRLTMTYTIAGSNIGYRYEYFDQEAELVLSLLVNDIDLEHLNHMHISYHDSEASSKFETLCKHISRANAVPIKFETPISEPSVKANECNRREGGTDELEVCLMIYFSDIKNLVVLAISFFTKNNMYDSVEMYYGLEAMKLYQFITDDKSDRLPMETPKVKRFNGAEAKAVFQIMQHHDVLERDRISERRKP